MQVKTFIEKAREGGWHFHINYELQDLVNHHSHEIFLDPLAWQAVGKVEGWEPKHYPTRNIWKVKMHRMIDALAEGKTIEEFLKTL